MLILDELQQRKNNLLELAFTLNHNILEETDPYLKERHLLALHTVLIRMELFSV